MKPTEVDQKETEIGHHSRTTDSLLAGKGGGTHCFFWLVKFNPPGFKISAKG